MSVNLLVDLLVISLVDFSLVIHVRIDCSLIPSFSESESLPIINWPGFTVMSCQLYAL